MGDLRRYVRLAITMVMKYTIALRFTIQWTDLHLVKKCSTPSCKHDNKILIKDVLIKEFLGEIFIMKPRMTWSTLDGLISLSNMTYTLKSILMSRWKL